MTFPHAKERALMNLGFFRVNGLLVAHRFHQVEPGSEQRQGCFRRRGRSRQLSPASASATLDGSHLED